MFALHIIIISVFIEHIIFGGISKSKMDATTVYKITCLDYWEVAIHIFLSKTTMLFELRDINCQVSVVSADSG